MEEAPIHHGPAHHPVPTVPPSDRHAVTLPGTSPPARTAYAFDRFLLIPDRQLLLEDDQPVRLGNRALDILTLLVRRAGELVGKREILRQVWPQSVVEDSNIKVNMAALRRALGAGASGEAFIATTRGRGYRFVGSVLQVRPPDLPGTGSGPAAPTRRLPVLPVLPTPLVGRELQVETLMADVRRYRLVSLVGPAGVGKTALATLVATGLSSRFPDGASLVDLAAVHDPAVLPAVIAAELGLIVEGPLALAALCRHLQGKDLLLVLDTCEACLDPAAACIDEMLRRCPGLRLLITSREPLRVSGECVRRVQGLLVPPGFGALTAAEALCYCAVRLLVDRAIAHSGDFVLCDAQARAAAELCRRLDGLPLAIELAAARMSVQGLANLLRQLEDGVHLLGGRRGAPDRHRDLDAALAWGWRHLSAHEVRLLLAVSVMDGAFDVQAAARLMPLQEDALPDLLRELACKSWLVLDLSSGVPTYRLLETTRAYCRMRLTLGRTRAVEPPHAVA